MNIDVMTVHDENKLLNYCTTFLGYGYFGNIAFDSSNLRWMGPFRYTWCGRPLVITLIKFVFFKFQNF